MKVQKLLLTGTILLSLTFTACKKQAGLGGNSAITGKVMVNHYNQNFTILKNQEVAIDEYVYLVFDTMAGYGTRVRTSYDGTFEFTNLRKGKYTVYCYSMDTTKSSSNGYIAVKKDLEITENRSITDIGTLTIADNKAVGYATITGKIKEIDTQNNTQYYIGEQRVYIIYDNDINYTTSIKTNQNGEYAFYNLPVGTYTVYTYSKDVNNNYPGPTYAVEQQVTISTINEQKTIPDLVIYR